MITHAIVKFAQPIPEDRFELVAYVYSDGDYDNEVTVQPVDAAQAGRAESALQYAQANNASEASLTDLIEVLR